MDNCPHYALENYTHTQMSAFTHEAMFACRRSKDATVSIVCDVPALKAVSTSKNIFVSIASNKILSTIKNIFISNITVATDILKQVNKNIFAHTTNMTNKVSNVVKYTSTNATALATKTNTVLKILTGTLTTLVMHIYRPVLVWKKHLDVLYSSSSVLTKQALKDMMHFSNAVTNRSNTFINRTVVNNILNNPVAIKFISVYKGATNVTVEAFKYNMALKTLTHTVTSFASFVNRTIFKNAFAYTTNAVSKVAYITHSITSTVTIVPELTRLTFKVWQTTLSSLTSITKQTLKICQSGASNAIEITKYIAKYIAIYTTNLNYAIKTALKNNLNTFATTFSQFNLTALKQITHFTTNFVARSTFIAVFKNSIVNNYPYALHNGLIRLIFTTTVSVATNIEKTANKILQYTYNIYSNIVNRAVSKVIKSVIKLKTSIIKSIVDVKQIFWAKIDGIWKESLFIYTKVNGIWYRVKEIDRKENGIWRNK